MTLTTSARGVVGKINNNPRSIESNRQTATPKVVGTMFDVKPYVLQEDTSEDGAATEQQGQQTHQSHQDVQELPGIALT